MSFSSYADGFGATHNNDNVDKKNDPNTDDDNGKCNKPVYLSNGIEVYNQTDIKMNGLFPIELKRYYTSSTDYDSSLGFGWAFAHNKRLFEYPDNSVSIRYGCGWTDRYVKSGGQYQTPQGGLEGTLVENGDGTYTRTYRDGTVDFYDTEGRLVKQKSPLGHFHQYTYDPAGLLPLTGVSEYAIDPNKPMVVAKQYRLIKVEEFAADGLSTGNLVEFNYHATTGRLTKAVAKTALDTVGRTITYQHDLDGIVKGRLEKVIGLEGIESTYEYSKTNSRLVTSFQEGVNTTPYVNIYEGGAPYRVTHQDYGKNSNEDESQYRLGFSYPTSIYQSVVRKTVYDHEDKILYSNVATKYDFGDTGYVDTITDPYGNQTTIQRDALNNLKREEFWTNKGTMSAPKLTLTKAIDYVFDADGNKRQETTHSGGQWSRTTWTYDHGWIASEETTSNLRDANTFRTEFTFYRDAQGAPSNIHEIKRLKDDGSFQTTTLAYDSKNRISSVQYPDGHIIRADYELGSLYPTHIYHEVAGVESPYLNYRLAYDNWGNINSITDAKSQTTSFVFDNLDRIVQVTNALNETNYYRYRDKQLAEVEIGATVEEGEGLVYKLLYTPKEKLKQVLRKNEAGMFQALWTFKYDSAGNLLHSSDALNRTLSYTYDYLDRMTSKTDPLGYITQYEHDIVGNITKVTDAENRDTQYEYDGFARVTKIIEKGVSPSLTTQIVYDALGKVKKVIDPKYQITEYEYDLLSRMVKQIKPLGQTIQYAYDARNRLDYAIYERNQKLDYTYEPWGPLKQTDFYPDTTSTVADRQINRNYDLNGNLTSITDTAIMPTPVYTSTYDAINRVDTSVNLSFSPYRQLDYDYDRFGNTSQLKVSNSSTADGTDWLTEYVQQYAFNKQNLLKQMTFTPGQPIQLTHYASDQLKQVSMLHGTTIEYNYYGNSPLKWIDVAHNGARKEKHRFSYDKVSNVKEIGNNQGVHNFDYDGINRLTSASHPAPTGLPAQETFAYDAAGNREDSSNSTAYDYDANNRILKSPNVGSYVYDDSGNLIQRGTDESFTYNHENRLSQYTNSATGVSANYTYDPFGRRIKKQVAQAGTTKVTHYLWEGQNLIAQYDELGNREKRYSYAPGQFAPTQIEDNTGIFDVHTDHLQTPILLTNSAGEIVWRAEYQAYGKALVNEDVDEDASLVSFDLRRPGQWLDHESGLFYNYFRYYDPSLGRYITSDPIGQAGGFNTYAYVLNNPLYWIDPLGLEVVCGDGSRMPKDKKLKDILDKLDKKYPNKDVVISPNTGNGGGGTRTVAEQERLRPNSGTGKDGTKISDHVQDQAADVSIDGVPPREVADAAQDLGASGTIPYTNHTHIDTNPIRQYHPRPSNLPSSQ